MRRWTTPDGLAFEGVQTGDGRIFKAGAFYWDGDKWPLRYDREDDGAHAGAVMIGSIDSMTRDTADDGTASIKSTGDLDDENDMGAQAASQLDNGQPLGVSVDMDDLEAEWVVSAENAHTEEVILFGASFSNASLTVERVPVTAGSTHTALAYKIWAPGIGRLHRQVFEDLGAPLTAAAGEPDLAEDDSIVLFSESTDEVLVRFLRARIRGATLVDIPAFDKAAIVLDPIDGGDQAAEADTLQALLAAAIGAADLPLAARDAAWDGSAAHQHQAGDGDTPDTATMRRGHFYRDDAQDPGNSGAYKLPFADMVDGELTAIPKGIFAVAGVLQGARGGADLGGDEDAIKSKVSAYYARMRKEFDDDSIVAPWDEQARGESTAAGRVFAAASAAVLASSGPAPVAPPPEWFARPAWTDADIVSLDDPKTGRKLRGVPMRYLDTGEVIGHLALWGQCHTGSPNGECVLTPRSMLDYVPFHHGHTELSDGSILPTGNLTMGGGHADGRLSYAGTIEHYDEAGTLVASGRAGEDEYGVWFHGAGMPDVWADDIAMRRLRACSPSGDWRPVGAGLELTAALAVNHPGFPVPRARIAASGEIQSLVAAGARELHLLAQAASGPSGARLADMVEDAVQRGIAGYLRQQEQAAKAGPLADLDRLRRDRAKRILQRT